MQQEIFNTKQFEPRWHQGTLIEKSVSDFQELVWDYYEKYGRDFSWRQTDNPYHIVVSEIMLQQTQTHRVETKYQQFIDIFPDFLALAQACQKEVINVWQGLGYNRRAVALHKIAQKVVDEFNGILPQEPEVLIQFPGIGPATASSICAFAFNKPTVFIETNIRAVFIHHFFSETLEIHDNQLLPLIEQTLPRDQARQWYYALMDYGVVLKKIFKNPARKSKHHTRQSKFEGSDRQVRGMIIKLLLEYQQLNHEDLMKLLREKVSCTPERGLEIARMLQEEGLISFESGYYAL